MQFGIPMRWRDPGQHDESACYVCQNKAVFKWNKYGRKNVAYKAVTSALLPVPHSDELPVPLLPSSAEHLVGSVTVQTETAGSDYAETEATTSLPTPVLMSQQFLDALVKKT